MNPKVAIPQGSSEYNYFDLSKKCITTSDFFTPKVVYSHYMMQKENWQCVANGMTRCMPMYKPAYANVNVDLRAFFVPFRTLRHDWTDWIENINNGVDNVNTVPYTTTSEIIEMLTQVDSGTGVGRFAYLVRQTSIPSPTPSTYSTPTDVDFVIDSGTLDSNNDRIFYEYKFNRNGRMVYDILLGLGYNLNFRLYASAASGNVDNFHLSLMPLLAYGKLFLDYYVNPRNDTQYKLLYGILDSFYVSNSKVTFGSVSEFGNYFSALLGLSYDNDYFTVAWENAFSPGASNLVSQIGINDLTTGSGLTVSSLGSVGPTVKQSSSSSVLTLSQWADTALHKISDLWRKYQLTGVRTVDRYLADHGIKLESAYLNRSIYIGHNSSPFQISDVTNTADTFDLDSGSLQGSTSGSYSGQAINYNLNGKFDYQTPEAGQIIILSTIRPDVDYYQGIPRELRYLDRYDFPLEQFGKLGVQGIGMFELKSDFIDEAIPAQTSYNSSTIIGYADRYQERKCNANSVLSGLFRLNSLNYGYDVWHLMREIPEYTKLDASFRQPTDRSQFNRIFNYQGNFNGGNVPHTNPMNYDGFIQVYNFKVKSGQPLPKLFDSYEWSDEDTKKSVVSAGGSFVG